MLRTDKDILDVSPPFLVLLPGARWRLAVHVFPHPEGLCVLEPFYDRSGAARVLAGRPWHVADEVWELDWGVQVVRLREGDYAGHACWDLWRRWLAHCRAAPPDPDLASRLAAERGAGVAAGPCAAPIGSGPDPV